MADPFRLQLLLATFAGWVKQHQSQVIDYLIEENRVLEEQLGKRRLRLTDDQRRRLAARGQTLGHRVLARIATIVTPDTILAWHRRLIDSRRHGFENKQGVARSHRNLYTCKIGSTMRSTTVLLLAAPALVILVAACSNPPPAAVAKAGRAQLLFRISENDGKIDEPVRVRVILRSRTGRAYDVSHSFPAEASGADIATFFERSFNGCGFKAFRSTRSVFVEPVYEIGANCSHDSVEVTFGWNSADLVKKVPLTRPEPPGER